jgi:tetratricopeptide (TPR) repeat protein
LAKFQLGRLYAETGQLSRALQMSEELEREMPKSPLPLLLTGGIQLAQQDFKKALESYTGAQKLAPNLPEVHRGLGQAYDGLGQHDRAIESYRKALAANADDVIVLNNLAWILAEVRRRPDDALPLAVKAEQLAPRSAEVLDTLAWIHYRRGDLGEARLLLSRAADRAPNNATIKYHQGIVYWRLGERDQAVSALRQAAQADPKLAQRENIPQLIKELGG